MTDEPTSGVEAMTTAELLRLAQVHRNEIGHFTGFQFVQALEKNLRAALATPAASPATKCEMCDGHGLIGGWRVGEGYDAEPCPECTPPATPSPAQVAETGWLIELKGVTPSWAIVNPNDYDEHWTTDSTRALRFARKVDAEAYIAHIGWTEAFASEHVWDDGRRSGYSDRSTADYLDKRLQEARDRSPDYEKLWAEEAERAEAAQEEIETLKALICRIEPYVDAIVCYASTMGEHEPNCIAHEVRAVCHGPSQDELVGRQIAAQMLVKIDAAASPPALAARSTEAWRDLDNARLQRAIDAFYEPCEGTTIDGIRNAILAWERG